MDFPRNSYIQQAKEEGHSEEFLTNTLSYIDDLLDKDLPVIFSRKHLAIAMGINLTGLNSLINWRHRYYKYYLISKKAGGFRRIIAPHPEMKSAQRWIKTNILDRLAAHSNATGFLKNKSILHNAKKHEGSDVILNLDLKNFFESISESRVYGIFKSFGYHPNVAVDLARICTTKISDEKITWDIKDDFQELLKNDEPFLAQGAPTSPGISNLICRRLDLRFSKLANSLGCNYSRYADDITFSGTRASLPKVRLVKKIITSENFDVNASKGGIFKKGQRQLVTGLLIDNSVRILKSYKKNIYRHLYFCKKYGVESHFSKLGSDKGYRKEWILGRIFFVHSIEPKEAAKMMEIVNEINWEI